MFLLRAKRALHQGLPKSEPCTRKHEPTKEQSPARMVCGDLDTIINLRSKSCKCKVFEVEKLPMHSCHSNSRAISNPSTLVRLYILSVLNNIVFSISCWHMHKPYTPSPLKKEWTNSPEAIRAMKVLEPDMETKLVSFSSRAAQEELQR